MLDERLRLIKVKALAPLAKRYADMKPMQITVAGLFTGLLCALMAATGQYWLALVFWLVNRVLDGLDGEVARFANKQSDWGGYADIMCDFAIYALIPFALAWSLKLPLGFFATAFLLATFYVNAASWLYLSALLEKRQHTTPQSSLTSIPFPSGLIEGTETVIFFTLFLVFPTFSPYLMIVMALLVIVTIFQRLNWAESQLQ